jgi:uncharacterized membrane protein YheB (UPF0754 family)
MYKLYVLYNMNEDLKQYLTNLLYAVHDRFMSRMELDKFIEEQINLIDEYFKTELCIV